MLSQIKPYVVDVSGIKDGIASLILGDDFEANGGQYPEQWIGELFRTYTHITRCVILNGCYAENQAREIVQHVDFLINVTKHDSEESEGIVLAFLNEFYYFLGKNVPVDEAFSIGRNRIGRRGSDKAQLPVLLTRNEEIQRRKMEEELLTLSQKIKDAPDNEELRVEQGDLLEQSGKHERASLSYQQALQIDGKNYESWWKNGIALFNAKNYDEAQQSYIKALSLRPPPLDEYVICREYGLLLESLEEIKESLRLYNKSLRTEPRYRAANYERKRAYKKLYYKR